MIRPGDAQRLSTVQDAVVPMCGRWSSRASRAASAASPGAVIGGIAGGSVGGRREAAAVGVLGAVAGAVIGNTVERFGTREEAVEILLHASGERRALVQAKAQRALRRARRWCWSPPAAAPGDEGADRRDRGPAVALSRRRACGRLRRFRPRRAPVPVGDQVVDVLDADRQAQHVR